MATPADGLFDGIARFDRLIAAARRAVRGKRRMPRAAGFMAGPEREAPRLERELREGSWRPGRYVEIAIKDPKPRLVSAAPFRDRVVHHALCAVIEPTFARGFVANSCANREGKGKHRGVDCYERYARLHSHVRRADIFRYFPAIDHAILKAQFRRRIGCARTLALMDRIVDSANPQEPVELYFPGDDLLALFARRRGLPIGNLITHFFANLHLDPLDHFATEVLAAPYVRYVDDFALFHDDPAVLAVWRLRIEAFLAKRRLWLHPRKTFIAPTSVPATFLGYELLGDGRRLLLEENVARFRNRLRGLRDRWRAGTINEADVRARVNSWIAHAEHADTWRLRAAIFALGWFDPSSQPSAEPGPSPASRSARRLVEQRTRERPLANRNRNTTTNRTNNRGFRVASTPP